MAGSKTDPAYDIQQRKSPAELSPSGQKDDRCESSCRVNAIRNRGAAGGHS